MESVEYADARGLLSLLVPLASTRLAGLAKIVSRQTALAARDMIRGLLKKTQVEALERNFFKNSEREHLERFAAKLCKRV